MPIQASFGRRLAALGIDWLFCVAIADLFTRRKTGGAAFTPLAIFFVEVLILTISGGSSFGQRVVGLKIINSDGTSPVSPVRIFRRAVLLCLILPAIFTKEGRGLHDVLSGTVVVRVVART